MIWSQHPEIIALDDQLSALNDSIDQEISQIVQSAKQQEQQLGREVSLLKQRMRAIKSQYASAGEAEIKLDAMQQELTTNQKILERLLLRVKETIIQKDERVFEVPARLISAPELSSAPILPNKKLVLAAAAATGLVLGFIIGFLIEFFKTGIKSSEEVEEKTGLKIVTMLPSVKVPSGQNKLATLSEFSIHNPYSRYAEAMRSVNFNIIKEKPGAKIICFTSAVPNEGKTITAFSYAHYLAKTGKKTLIIDCDLRKAHLRKGRKQVKEPGLSDVLFEKETFKNCRAKHTNYPVDILFPGLIKDPDIFVNKAQEFANLLTQLKQEYDYIVMDSPPIVTIVDAKHVLQHADICILCVRWNQTSLSSIKQVREILAGFSTFVLGGVMTMVDVKKARFYYSNDHSYFSKSADQYFSK